MEGVKLLPPSPKGRERTCDTSSAAYLQAICLLVGPLFYKKYQRVGHDIVQPGSCKTFTWLSERQGLLRPS